MDSGVPIPTTTTRWTKRATLPIQTVIVFGDSLCDIGKKWKTTTGQAAINQGQMYVSPTGRFSDCRNWTDFMFEEATGGTMICGTAQDTINTSESFTSLKSGNFLLNGPTGFRYANYAEGGACGDSPAGLFGAVLGTFKAQVDAFERDCKTSQLPLGNTLFIIWFGANDLYTAGRKSSEMGMVAQQVASEQRNRLAAFHKSWNKGMCGTEMTCKFIFVDLCRPLTTVRYTKRLEVAEGKVRALLGSGGVYTAPPLGGRPPKGSFAARTFQARHTLTQADSAYKPNWYGGGVPDEVVALRAQVEEIKNLEAGVYLYNATLKKTALANGDRVAEIGKCISEDSLLRLVRANNQANFRLRAGAMATASTTYMTSSAYNSSGSVQHALTKDEVHPTDQMYKLIWFEIREVIRQSKCTFGQFNADYAESPFASMQTQENYGAVMDELLAKVPRRG